MMQFKLLSKKILFVYIFQFIITFKNEHFKLCHICTFYHAYIFLYTVTMMLVYTFFSGLKVCYSAKNVHVRRFPSVGRELRLSAGHNCVVKLRALCTRRTRYRATHAVIRDFISRNVITSYSRRAASHWRGISS